LETRRQAVTLFTSVSLLIGIIVIIQLWLVAAALDALLGGQTAVLVPAAIASAVLLVINAGLLRLIVKLDSRVRRRTENDE
jgi:ABC-type transport system involved in cytochrome bd biosynthesis fused ATPase/permease subunit